MIFYDDSYLRLHANRWSRCAVQSLQRSPVRYLTLYVRLSGSIDLCSLTFSRACMTSYRFSSMDNHTRPITASLSLSRHKLFFRPRDKLIRSFECPAQKPCVHLQAQALDTFDHCYELDTPGLLQCRAGRLGSDMHSERSYSDILRSDSPHQICRIVKGDNERLASQLSHDAYPSSLLRTGGVASSSTMDSRRMWTLTCRSASSDSFLRK